jgi:hypothetical protein
MKKAEICDPFVIAVLGTVSTVIGAAPSRLTLRTVAFSCVNA